MHLVAEILRDLLVKRQAVVQQLLKAPDCEAIGIDIVIVFDLVQGFVFLPFRVEEFWLVVHWLWIFAKALDQHVEVLRCAFDVEHQRALAQFLQHGIVLVIRVHDFAKAAAGIADEVFVAVDFLGASDEFGDIAQGRDLGVAVLGLAALVFGKGNAALRGVTGLSKIGGEGGQIAEGDVGADVDRVRHQQLPEERVLHRLLLEIVDDVFAHVARTDAVIDGVLEPAIVLEEGCKCRLANAGHANDGDGLARLGGEVFT